jgi:hypothetical protein
VASPIPTPAARRPIDSASVWVAAGVADPSAWTDELTEAERAEIVAATAAARAAGTAIDTISRDDFPLPALGSRALEWSRRLNEGHGFVLLRGFPVDLLDEADTELAYVGLGTHLGNPVGQDKDASLLGHVRDEGVERTDPSVRLYRTRARQDFHTDGSDLVGLLCLHRAVSGGESRIASSAAVYNEMLRRRPDLVDVLYEPLHWDRNDEQSPGEDPAFALAPFSDVAGSPRIFYIGWYVRDAQRHPSVPRLTEAQLEAMDLLESIANDPAFHLEMDFQPGDIQLLNNARILHAREAYVDADDPAERRHLLRLWLTAHHFSSVESFLQGGIPQQQR